MTAGAGAVCLIKKLVFELNFCVIGELSQLLWTLLIYTCTFIFSQSLQGLQHFILQRRPQRTINAFKDTTKLKAPPPWAVVGF